MIKFTVHRSLQICFLCLLFCPYAIAESASDAGIIADALAENNAESGTIVDQPNDELAKPEDELDGQIKVEPWQGNQHIAIKPLLTEAVSKRKQRIGFVFSNVHTNVPCGVSSR